MGLDIASFHDILSSSQSFSSYHLKGVETYSCVIWRTGWVS